MKTIYKYILTTLIAATSINVQAITLNPDYTVSGMIAADQMTSSSGIFYDWSSPDLSPSSQRDPAVSITDDNKFNTFAYSLSANAYVDLGFSTPIYNGAGDDLAFLVVGNPATIDFSAIVSDSFGNDLLVSSSISPYNVQFQGNLNVNGQLISLSTVLIDLGDYGLDVFGTNPLTNIRFNLGSEFGSPGLSIAGGLHGAPVVVPLPLPIVLFISGLGLLAGFHRKNT